MISTLKLDKLTRVFSRSGNYFAVIYFLCSGVGGFYSLFYLFHGLWDVFCYEFFTFVCYWPVLYFARNDHPFTGPIAYAQFIHHQVFSTYLFGFESGFWLLLCCMYFAHFIFFSHVWAQLAATLFTTALVFGFYFAEQLGFHVVFSTRLFDDPLYGELAQDIFVVNLAFAVSFMIISGLIIHISANGRIDSLMNLVYKDFLTGLFNRKYILECVWPKMSRAPLCIAIADIDDFKKINDSYGHDQGDVVLKFAALLMQKSSTDGSFLDTKLARWGGEEFLIMAQTDDVEAFKRLLEHIRSELAKSNIFGNDRRVSVSIGAVSRADEMGFKLAFEQADKNLYIAKRTGKNMVVM